MLCVLAICSRDKEQAVKLANWIQELGGVSEHDCLLAVHKDTDSAGVIEPLTKAFARVAEFPVTDEIIVERDRYVYAANIMWKRAANHIADMNEPMPWLWIEPDSCPTVSTWMNDFAAEYKAFAKPFLHELVTTPTGQRNSGIGIYPARVRDYTDRLWQLSDTSWDVLLSPDFIQHTHHTTLIQDSFCMFGNPEIVPTFPDVASLSFIRKGVALFHRCKDGSVIDRLRERKTAPKRENVGNGMMNLDAAIAVDDGSMTALPAPREQQLLAEIERLNGLLSGTNGSKHSPAKTPTPKRKRGVRAKMKPVRSAAAQAKMRAARKLVTA